MAFEYYFKNVFYFFNDGIYFDGRFKRPDTVLCCEIEFIVVGVNLILF
jgi:hypothetical protein